MQEEFPRITWSSKIVDKYGIVTGANSRHEWMLPWWYDHFRKFNKNMPVIFADFGMNKEKRNWCKANGNVINLRHKMRRDWFKKPLAMLYAPFKRVFWIDLDCEIRGSVEPLFEYISESRIAVTHDTHTPWVKTSDPVASGVVGARHGNKMIVDWAKGCNGVYSVRGDQEVLNKIIQGRLDEVAIMPLIYQWLRLDGENKDAIIMHWTGSNGKAKIREFMKDAGYKIKSNKPKRSHTRAGLQRRPRGVVVHKKNHQKCQQRRTKRRPDNSEKTIRARSKKPRVGKKIRPNRRKKVDK